ncbi:MAG TPA: D-glycerate dehydrogenase [Burkholderiales bacterium]|nr:D-glycerate dehydrogenase [Burkholderiales bacterium]
MKKKVLVTRAMFDETLAYLAQHFDITSNQADEKYPPDELGARLQGMDAAVITSTDRVDEALLSRCPGLKAVCSASVGYNHVDVAACTRRGVMVTNTPGVLTDSVADYAVCLTLATCRRLTEAESMLRRGEWKGTHLKELLGMDLHHATVGIFGFGRIGQVIARRLTGFEPRILYCTRNRVARDIERDLKATFVGKDELLRQSDIVILILPYTRETHHFIGARELGLMKRKAVLINMARGGIVDDAALIEALKARRIWAAGLDVYENEPNLNPGLLAVANVVLSPHIASASEPTRQAMAMAAARNCVAALTTGNPPNLLNRDVLRQDA